MNKKNSKQNNFFIHARKTGGTSFHTIVKNAFQYEDNDICDLRSEVDLKAKISKKDRGEYLRQFNFISGHFVGAYYDLKDEYKSYMIFRDPVHRVVSAYNHVQNDIKDPLRKHVLGCSFIECITNPKVKSEFQNHQTKLLLANTTNLYLKDECLDELKPIIIQSLESLFFIGINDDLDLSKAMLMRKLGQKIESFESPRVNTKITKKGISINDLNESEVKELKKLNMLDEFTYHAARNIFIERLKKLKTVSPKKEINIKYLNSRARLIRDIEGPEQAANFYNDCFLTSLKPEDWDQSNKSNTQVLETFFNEYKQKKEVYEMALDFKVHFLKNAIQNRNNKIFEDEKFFKNIEIRFSSQSLRLPTSIIIEKKSEDIIFHIPITFAGNNKILIRRILYLEIFFDNKEILEKNKQNFSAELNISDGHIIDIDNENLICFSSSYNNYLIPDPTFLSSSGYKNFLENIKSLERKKIQKIFWRGGLTGTASPIIEELKKLPRYKFPKLSIKNDYLDLKITTLGNYKHVEGLKSEMEKDGIFGEYIDNIENIHYSGLLDIDGNSSSWPGLYTKLLTGNTVVKLREKNPYKQWYYSGLIDHKNIIYISDFEDLEEITDFMIKFPKEFKEIGFAGKKLVTEKEFQDVIGKELTDLINNFAGKSL